MFDSIIEFLWAPITLHIFLAVSLTSAGAIAARYVLQRLESAIHIPEWIKLLNKAWRGSISWLIGIYGLLLAIEIIGSTEMLMQIRSIYAVLGGTWLLICWKREFEQMLIRRTAGKRSRANEKALVYAIGKLSTILIFTVVGLMILKILHTPLEPLLAFGGIGGLAISWAGKDVVANLFGGLMIYIHRPFAVGDWIYSPNKHFEGTVEDIGWYMTRIRTFERRPTYIPNAIITDAIVENPQRMYNRRIKAMVGIRYQDVSKVEVIVKDIEAMLKEHPAIDQKQTLMVHLVEFGPSSLNIEVYTFTKTTDWADWREIQQGVFIKIAEIIASHGAEIAFPTSTLHLESGSKDPSFESLATKL